MSGKLRGRLTFANVVSVISLLFALGLGSAWAATELAKNSVKSKHIKEGHVKRGDIAASAVDSSKVGDGTLLGEDFAPGQLPRGPQGPPGPSTGAAGGDLSGSYPDPTIAGGAVTPAKLGTLPAARAEGDGYIWDGATCDTDLPHNAERPVVYRYETFDRSGLHAAAAPGGCLQEATKLVAPRPGVYAVSAGFTWTDPGVGADIGTRELTLKKNGSSVVAGQHSRPNPTGNTTVQGAAGLVELQAGDYVEAYVRHRAGEGMILDLIHSADGRTFIAMHWVGP